ncbi:Uma2 family endonuclease [Telmatocola sphagniphila]|uniref:Uma2 family endonuclease n=1 Tax=Telmatocola sphagniphila TaxID=1123043 RepID=A0A8E6F0M5_9BACT|nr:Uma2 family endonuclease [Telmatocola sphagniphila]QVL34706.1 Uma2 family endonuclease [Telmatocola sphagniphila]
MSAIPKKRLTEAEYLAIERAAPFKSEFFNGEMFAMAGTSVRHAIIKDNLCMGLNLALRGGPCRAVTSDVRVRVTSTGIYTYPDVLVLRQPAQYLDNELDTLLNPKVIFEVLSESTEKYDRGKKFDHYRSLDSLQEYILVSQHETLCERFVRQVDGSWNITFYKGEQEALELESLKVKIPLKEIYVGVDFTQQDEAQGQTT